MYVKKQTHHGQWWLSTAPDKKAYGALEIAKSGRCTLKLSLTSEQHLGNFFNIHNTQSKGSYTRIVGDLYTGETATLEDVKYRPGSFKNNIYNIIFEPSYVFISYLDFKVNIDELNKNEIKINNLHLDIDGIDNFIHKNSIEGLSNLLIVNEGKKKAPPELITLFAKKDLNLDASSSFHISQSQSKISKKRTTKFVISSPEPRSLSDWQDDILSLNFFICILFGEPIPLKSIQSRELNKIFNFIFHSEPFSEHKIKPFFEMPLFKYTENEDINIGELLYYFIKLRCEYPQVFKPFFSSKFSNELYEEIRFFLIVTALEGFYRQVRCNHNSSQEDLILKDMLNVLFKDVDRALDTTHNWNDLAKRIVPHRHETAHGIKNKKQPSIENMEETTAKLHSVFVVLFLNEAATLCKFTKPLKWNGKSNWLRLPPIIP